jgi:hypothetical protein
MVYSRSLGNKLILGPAGLLIRQGQVYARAEAAGLKAGLQRSTDLFVFSRDARMPGRVPLRSVLVRWMVSWLNYLIPKINFRKR